MTSAAKAQGLSLAPAPARFVKEKWGYGSSRPMAHLTRSWSLMLCSLARTDYKISSLSTISKRLDGV